MKMHIEKQLVLNKKWIMDDKTEEILAEENFIIQWSLAYDIYNKLWNDDYDEFEEFLDAYEPETQGQIIYLIAKEKNEIIYEGTHSPNWDGIFEN